MKRESHHTRVAHKLPFLKWFSALCPLPSLSVSLLACRPSYVTLEHAQNVHAQCDTNLHTHGYAAVSFRTCCSALCPNSFGTLCALVAVRLPLTSHFTSTCSLFSVSAAPTCPLTMRFGTGCSVCLRTAELDSATVTGKHVEEEATILPAVYFSRVRFRCAEILLQPGFIGVQTEMSSLSVANASCFVFSAVRGSTTDEAFEKCHTDFYVEVDCGP